MRKYVLRASCHHAHSQTVIETVLALPEMQRLIFPAAHYPTSNYDDRILIINLHNFETRHEYNLDNFLDKATTEQRTFFRLSSQDQVQLEVSIWYQELIIPNIVLIQFSEAHLYGDNPPKITAATIKTLIHQLAPVFQPTEILVYDSTIYYTPDVPDKKYRIIQLPNQRKFDAQIGWMTFWAEPVVNFLGRERFERLSSCAEKIEMHGGFLLVLQHEPFRRDNAEHREREAQVLRELGLLE